MQENPPHPVSSRWSWTELDPLQPLPSRYIVQSRKVYTARGLQPAALVVSEGRLEQLLPIDLSSPSLSLPDFPLIDAADALLLPAFVDAHVHCNEPGRVDWEGFETATKAASAGGIAALVDMPLNSIPVTTHRDALRLKRRETQDKLWCDVGFWGGIVPGNLAELEPMIHEGVLGFKAFLCPSGIDDYPPASEEDLAQALPILARHGVPLIVHAELCPAEQPESIASVRYQDYVASRPDDWEVQAIRMLERLAKRFGTRIYVVHLSSAQAIEACGDWPAPSASLQFETCPHYLTFAAEEIPDGATAFKCAPPIRSRANRERLWELLRSEHISTVCSDHSPCTADLKLMDSGDFMNAWGGISSLQLSPAIILSQALARGFTLQQVVKWMNINTSALAIPQAPRGPLQEGMPATFSLWRMNVPWTVDQTALFHKNKVSPYHHLNFTAQNQATFLRGKLIYAHGKHSLTPLGRALDRRSSEPLP